MLHKLNILFLVIFLITITGCSEDYLETRPTDAISAADALSSPDNMMLVLNGLHRQLYAQSPLPGGTSYRSGEHYWIPQGDVLVGNLIHSARANNWMGSELRWLEHTDASSTSSYHMWYQRYHIIASANAVINKVVNDDLTIDADMNNILGQSYAYRAWAYHKLVTHYAKGYLIGNPSSDPGVPLLFASESPYTSEPRSTVAEIYAHIESDIDKAIAHFENASAPANKSHLSINAAYGIKARIALSKGDWNTAASAAVLARQGYPILNESQWLSGFNTTDLPEVIWGGRVIGTETTYYRSYFYLIAFAFNGSQNRGNPKLINSEMYDKIPATDYRNKVWLPLAPNSNSSASNGLGGSYLTDPNYDNEADWKAAKAAIIEEYGATSRHNTHPYMQVKLRQKNPGTIDPDDVIYMRSSEMVLIEAEAKAMSGDISGAQNALGLLGEERDSAFDKTAYNTQDDLMDQIKFQRYVELWGEGFGYIDHIRWDMGFDLMNSGASEVLYQNGFIQAKPSTNSDWVWKIPQDEIDSNPNINEGNQN